MKQAEAIIIGGGPAGLAAGIHLAIKGYSVIILEKNAYPNHKVCGEYLSNEIMPYLNWLGVDVRGHNPPDISRFNFSQVRGKAISADLPLGGIGISRYLLDNLMYQRALQAGCTVLQATVNDIRYEHPQFVVETDRQDLVSSLVLGAFGKWSNIDKVFSRSFTGAHSQWMAVKAHYRGDVPDNEVSLHSFTGGYCGVSKIEGGSVNICYLAHTSSFRKYRNITAYEKEVLAKNKKLQQILLSSKMVFEKPIAISKISFERKNPVERHILMVGDTAGLIHPLCGNGMAMALHSGKIAAELSNAYLRQDIDRETLEKDYTRLWNRHFRKRLLMGRMLAKIIASPVAARPVFFLFKMFPFLMRIMIKQTHGKVVTI